MWQRESIKSEGLEHLVTAPLARRESNPQSPSAPTTTDLIDSLRQTMGQTGFEPARLRDCLTETTSDRNRTDCRPVKTLSSHIVRRTCEALSPMIVEGASTLPLSATDPNGRRTCLTAMSTCLPGPSTGTQGRPFPYPYPERTPQMTIPAAGTILGCLSSGRTVASPASTVVHDPPQSGDSQRDRAPEKVNG